MNVKRIAELAIHINDNYNKDHGTLKAPDGREFVFNMRTYFGSGVSKENSCGYSCCAFGYACLLWPEDMENKIDLSRPSDWSIGERDRAKIFSIDDPHPILDKMYHRLFDSAYPNDPTYYAMRTVRFLHDLGYLKNMPSKPSGAILMLRRFVKRQEKLGN
jgi:hypothetical protein